MVWESHIEVSETAVAMVTSLVIALVSSVIVDNNGGKLGDAWRA